METIGTPARSSKLHRLTGWRTARRGERTVNMSILAHVRHKAVISSRPAYRRIIVLAAVVVPNS